MAAVSEGVAPQGDDTKGLKHGALRIGDVVIMALASSGPTQSIAVGMFGLMLAVAYHTFLPILICFIPMIGIAIGYQRLNAWQPSATNRKRGLPAARLSWQQWTRAARSSKRNSPRGRINLRLCARAAIRLLRPHPSARPG